MASNPDLIKKGHVAQGQQRDKLPVYDSGAEVTSNTLTFPIPMRELLITNDSDDDITVQVLGLGVDVTFTLLGEFKEILDERLPEFDTVVVTSTGNWRWIVRSGNLE